MSAPVYALPGTTVPSQPSSDPALGLSFVVSGRWLLSSTGNSAVELIRHESRLEVKATQLDRYRSSPDAAMAASPRSLMIDA